MEHFMQLETMAKNEAKDHWGFLRNKLQDTIQDWLMIIKKSQRVLEIQDAFFLTCCNISYSKFYPSDVITQPSPWSDAIMFPFSFISFARDRGKRTEIATESK